MKQENLEIGRRIADFLQVNETTQTVLAQTVGVHQAYLNQIITGKKRISATVILGIANGYTDLNLNWLLRGQGAMFIIP